MLACRLLHRPIINPFSSGTVSESEVFRRQILTSEDGIPALKELKKI